MKANAVFMLDNTWNSYHDRNNCQIIIFWNKNKYLKYQEHNLIPRAWDDWLLHINCWKKNKIYVNKWYWFPCTAEGKIYTYWYVLAIKKYKHFTFIFPWQAFGNISKSIWHGITLSRPKVSYRGFAVAEPSVALLECRKPTSVNTYIIF